MPKPLQTASFDRPWLASMSTNDAADISLMLEALVPPPDDAASGWALRNLARCLEALLPECTGDAKAWLSAEMQSALRAAALLPAQTTPPDVTLHADKVTLFPCFAALRLDDSSSKLAKLLGALYVLTVTGGRPAPEPAMELVLRACLSTRQSDAADAQTSIAAALVVCSRQLTRALRQLRSAAVGRRSAATSMIEAKVEKAFRSGYRFDSDQKIAAAITPRGLTANDVEEAGPKLREAAQNGSPGALLAALALWHGVMPVYVGHLPLFSPTAGFMRTDSTCSFTVVKLGGVLTELARTEWDGVLPTSDELTLPWPIWISELIRRMREANPQALSLGDLPGMPHGAVELRRLLNDLPLPRRITASKLVVDRALPLLRSDIDPIRAALACLDFSRIFKVSAAYEHARSGELLEALSLRAERLDWGALSPSPVASTGHLSAVTPELERVRSIGQRLFGELASCLPGPNAGPGAVFAHHDAFVRYTAFLLAAGLALRGQERNLLPASLFLTHSLAGDFDKSVPGASSSPVDLVLGAALRLQLRYLRAHYLALRDRLKNGLARYSPNFSKMASELLRVVQGDPALPLLVLVAEDGLKTLSLLDLVDYLGEDWSGKADALRHALPDILRAHGTAYASREASLRHVGGSQAIVSLASAWSRGEWIRESSRLQDLMLDEIGVKPHGGLVHSLGSKS